jgi:hypothetical protein
MVALVLYGAFCLFCLVAFLIWASVAKLRPELDEPEFDLYELEKLRKIAGGEQPDSDPEALDPKRDDPPPPAPRRPVIGRRRGLFQGRRASRHGR